MVEPQSRSTIHILFVGLSGSVEIFKSVPLAMRMLGHKYLNRVGYTAYSMAFLVARAIGSLLSCVNARGIPPAV